MSFWRDVHRLHVGDISCLRICYLGSSIGIFHIENIFKGLCSLHVDNPWGIPKYV